MDPISKTILEEKAKHTAADKIDGGSDSQTAEQAKAEEKRHEENKKQGMIRF